MNYESLVQALTLKVRNEKEELEFEVKGLSEPGAVLFGWTYADENRLEDFLTYIENNESSGSDLKALFSLIVFSLNFHIQNCGNGEKFWNRIFGILIKNESSLSEQIDFLGAMAGAGSFLAYSVLTTDFNQYKRNQGN